MIDLQAQVLAVDALVIVTLCTAVSTLRRILGGGRYGWLAVAMPLLALLWGMAWKFWPPLAAVRLQPPPGGQAAGIFLLIMLLISPLLATDFRARIHSLDWRPLAAFSYWRAVYGAILILLGVQGALPPGFFWSAGLGDISAGVWGLWIASRKVHHHTVEFKVWNGFALADLVHVLVLGAIHLRPFFLENPDVPPITNLPLAAVPFMVPLHVFAAVALWKKVGAVDSARTRLT